MSKEQKLELALIEAAQIGNTEEIYRLIQEGVNVNATNENELTAIMVVIENSSSYGFDLGDENNYIKTIKTLVEAKADVNATDKDGRTAIIICCQK